MNKNLRFLSFLSLTTISLSLFSAPASGFSGTLGLFGEDASTWVHYAKREATSSLDGIREYWVNCGGGYRFSRPNSSNIKEGTSYDTSEFEVNDPRYIKYVSDDVNAFYVTSSLSFDFSEISYLDGYTASGASSEAGTTTRLEFVKDDVSPAYSVSCLSVTDTIASNDDLTALQNDINDGIVTGYYVMTADLTKPTSVVTTNGAASGSTAGVFSGTFDGRGHTITSPSFWNRRMLGDVKNGTVKDIVFENISIFSILAVTLTDSVVQDVEFYTATFNTWSNVGMICDVIYGSTQFNNVYIDYGVNYHLYPGGSHGTAPVAATNMTVKDNQTFVNCRIRCLPSVNVFLADYYGRNLRPTSGITYVDTFKFIDNGTMNYSIKYIANNTAASKAAAALKTGIEAATGKTIVSSSFSSEETFDDMTPAIILGDDTSAADYYVTLPTAEGGYTVSTIGKAVYINSYDEYGWQPAVLKFLKTSLGYEHISDGISINTIEDKNNVSIYPISISEVSQFNVRRADWGDSGHSDNYADGYNSVGYTSTDVFVNVPGGNGDPYLDSNERFHTMLRVLYPGTYVGTHKKWYASDANDNTLSKVNDSYYTWQLCFTAHGDSDEYSAMVTEATDNIITIFANDTNLEVNNICFAIGDSYNYCKCSSCAAKLAQYGANSGAMLNFVNDVASAVNARVSETKRTRIVFSTFAYCSYRAAPVVNGSPTIQCGDNVNIFIAPIEANFTYSIGDSTNNAESYEMFEEWAQVGSIYAWLYDTNFSHYLYPYNSFKGMTESIKYMKEKGVKLAYIEGQHNLYSQKRTGFFEFKKYLNGQYMIDTEQNFSDLQYKFFKNYYGSGYEKMNTFFNELTARMETFETDTTLNNILTSNGSKRSIYADIDSAALWDKDQLVRWANLCSEAYAAESDATIKTHILQESIFPRFALCTLFASSYSDTELTALRTAFKTDATSLNITTTSEGNQTPMSTYYTNWGV